MDIDNDGDLDLYVCNYDAPNLLYVNQGDGTFSESAESFGLNVHDASLMAAFCDYDRDGQLDVYLLMNRYFAADRPAPGEILQRVGGRPTVSPEFSKYYALRKLPNGRPMVDGYGRDDRLLRNNGNGSFSDVTVGAGIQGAGRGLSATWWDYNQDEYPDLYVGNDFVDPDRLYRNNGDGTFTDVIAESVPHTTWFSMGADAADINNDGRCDLFTVDMAATSHFKAKVNMGDMDGLSKWFLENAWPRQYMRNALYLNTGTSRFLEVASLAGVVSSNWSWAANFADLDNDGRVDLLINNGMSRNFMDSDVTKSFDSGDLARKTEWDRFAQQPTLREQNLGFRNLGDLQFENVSKHWGLDHVGMSFGAAIGDRLYLNDGQGGFSKAPDGTLPESHDSGSVVTAADYDHDGDLDLFVGGRVIPGKYPLTPTSQLLQNQGGIFKDITDELAPGLSQTGLVTSAVWSDTDGDGWVDLLVAHEWGPIKLYRNRQGKLVDETISSGLAHLLGWWNGIAARDLDGDRDIDLVVTNLGLNTKYHASRDKPALLYYGDFDGTSNNHLLEAEYEIDTLYPVRGKSCSTQAMPFLANKFPKFKDFAIASLEQIYTPKRMSEAHRWQANTFESGVLINNGKGEFQFRALPRLAQTSPGFGVVLTEVDGDGNADAFIVQNFFGPQPETGRMDGGLSVLLLGKGDGTFESVGPDKSGLIVSADAKGLSAADFNGDGAVDFVVAINNEKPMLFENRVNTPNRTFVVKLQGKQGNPTAVGARISVVLSNGSAQTAEVQAGGGYLSQSSSRLVFGVGSGHRVESVEVSWPD